MSVIDNTASSLGLADGRVEMGYRGRIWAGGPIETAAVAVEKDGTVLVHDPVAGHWTTCHSISRRGLRQIRQVATGL